MNSKQVKLVSATVGASAMIAMGAIAVGSSDTSVCPTAGAAAAGPSDNVGSHHG